MSLNSKSSSFIHSRRQNFLLFQGQIMFYYVYVPHLAYPFTQRCALGLLPLFTIGNSLLWTRMYRYLLENLLSILWGIFTVVVLLDSSMFNFLRNHHTVFHSSCAILHSHQWCSRVIITPLPCPQLLFSMCLFFNNSHPDGWEAVSHCGFNLYFSND